jgi:hypothetical protein
MNLAIFGIRAARAFDPSRIGDGQRRRRHAGEAQGLGQGPKGLIGNSMFSSASHHLFCYQYTIFEIIFVR